MKKLLFSLLFLGVSFSINAQLNRYPYIQSTTTSSTIIAWKTVNAEIGAVAFGLSATNLTDTLYEIVAAERHALTLKNLQTDTKYYYSILSGTNTLASEYFFTASDSVDQEFSFIQYGDCGYDNSSQATIGALMEADDASFAVVCGDVDQGGVPHISGSQGGDDYDEIYFDVYNDGTTSKMLSQECHYTAIGNHDTYANNGATYELEFHLPHNNPDSSERYYSFEWGDAKFIALDVITPFDPTVFPINQTPINQRWWTDFRPGSAQYDFLVNELQCNDKKWVFVYFHEGPWTNYWGVDYNLPNALGGDYYQYEGNLMVRQHLVPVFEQYDVDFVLVGHSHLYEQAEKNGVWYITSGGAGDVGGSSQYGNNPEILKSIVDNMYVKFMVDSNTVSYDVINASNTVIDTFSLTKPYIPYAVNAVISDVTCFNGTDGSIALTVQGPKPPYTVEWFDASTNFTKTGLAAGTYYAYIRNAYGCEKVSSFTIAPAPMLQATIISPTGNFIFCENDSILLSTDQAYAGYLWSNGATTATTTIDHVTGVNVSVTDTNGCTYSATTIQTQEILNPIANFGFANNQENYNFLCTEPNATNYYWDFGDGVIDSSSTNAINHIYTSNGSFYVSLVIVNACDSSSATRTILVNSFPPDTTNIRELYVQNALEIAPNPFNYSTQVRVTGLGEDLRYTVFNLIGEKVLEEEVNNNVFYLYKNALANGTYYLKITNDKGQYSYSKIMIN